MTASKWKFRVKANHGNETPSNFIFLYGASEVTTARRPMASVKMAHRFKMAYGRSCRYESGKWVGWKESWFDNPEAIWFWVRERSQRRRPTWIFSHNWQFQSQLLGWWNELDAGRFKLTLPKRERVDVDGKIVPVRQWQGMCAIDHKVFVVYATSHCGTVKLVDVRNYFDMGLAEIGKSFGCFISTPANLDDHRSDSERHLTEAINAISTAMRATIDAWKQGNRGNWQPTAARLAWSNFRHECVETDKEYKERIKLEKRGVDCSDRAKYTIDVIDPDHDREFQRRSFYGGRVSNWFRGHYKGKVFKVDCNGLYPAMMERGLYPTSIMSTKGEYCDDQIAGPLFTGQALAEVEVWGCGDLPRRKPDRSIEFPQGIFRTVLAGPELSYADRNGRVRRYFRWVQYHCEPIFKRYVRYWWTIRQQAKSTGNVAEANLAKLMGNCLFGVFAKRRPTWTINGKVQPPFNWGHFFAPKDNTGKITLHRCVGGSVQVEGDGTERDDTFPAISAWIASNGRMYMDYVRAMLPARSVLLQCVDGWVLTEAGIRELQQTIYWNESVLGCFRLVAEADGCEVVDGNHYTMGDREVLAGCPDDRIKYDANSWLTRRTETAADVVGGGLKDEIGIVESTYHVERRKNDREYDETGWYYM